MEGAYALVGLLVGLAVGLTGIGGGSLMTPLLVLVFGLPAAVAVGTDLIYACLTKFAGVWVYHRERVVVWPVVALLLTGSLPGALLTIVFLARLADGLDLDSIIKPTLGAALLVTGFVLMFRERLGRLAGRRLGRLRAGLSRRTGRITVAVGLVMGVLVTLSSVGAGAIGTVALLSLYPGLPLVSIVATELAHAVILTAVAGLGHWHLGTVDVSLLALLLMGSLPGVWLGSRIGLRLPEHYVRPILAGMLLCVGLRFAL